MYADSAEVQRLPRDQYQHNTDTKPWDRNRETAPVANRETRNQLVSTDYLTKFFSGQEIFWQIWSSGPFLPFIWCKWPPLWTALISTASREDTARHNSANVNAKKIVGSKRRGCNTKLHLSLLEANDKALPTRSHGVKVLSCELTPALLPQKVRGCQATRELSLSRSLAEDCPEHEFINGFVVKVFAASFSFNIAGRSKIASETRNQIGSRDDSLGIIVEGWHETKQNLSRVIILLKGHSPSPSQEAPRGTSLAKAETLQHRYREGPQIRGRSGVPSRTCRLYFTEHNDDVIFGSPAVWDHQNRAPSAIRPTMAYMILQNLNQAVT